MYVVCKALALTIRSIYQYIYDMTCDVCISLLSLIGVGYFVTQATYIHTLHVFCSISTGHNIVLYVDDDQSFIDTLDSGLGFL